MWNINRTDISAGVQRYRFLNSDSTPLSFRQAVDLWADEQQGEMFRLFTSLAIASSTYQALRWETPSVNAATVDREFEFVLIDAPSLQRKENPLPFADPFKTQIKTDPSQIHATFPNIGRNAIMVAPLPTNSAGVNHCHLASYLRTADQADGNALWLAVGKAMQVRLNERDVWLNTAGGGVAWLHVRLDDRPKYYHHAEYKTG